MEPELGQRQRPLVERDEVSHADIVLYVGAANFIPENRAGNLVHAPFRATLNRNVMASGAWPGPPVVAGSTGVRRSAGSAFTNHAP